MKKRTRLLILLFCVICFLLIAPFLVAYSMGYRFDFEKNKVVITGGVYVRTFPSAEQIIVDSKIYVKPGIFSSAVFVQSLLPKNHTVRIQKNGYYDYFKALPVQEGTVTKLENVTLFKKSLTFSLVSGNAGYFSIAPNSQNIITIYEDKKSITVKYFDLNSTGQKQEIAIAGTGEVLDIKWAENSEAALIKTQSSGKVLYYFLDVSLPKATANPLPYLDKNSNQISFNPKDNKEIFYEENGILYSLKNQKPKTIIKNLLTYEFYRNNILWLSSQGGLYESDALGNLINTFSKNSLKGSINKDYKISVISENIFLENSNPLLMYNSDGKTFESVFEIKGNYEIENSPDNKNLIFCGSENIYVYSMEKNEPHKISAGEKIENCQWLNNDYIIFTNGNQIIISEIDYRGNINTVTMADAIFNAPEIFYMRQSGKLYILTDSKLIASEKLTP